MKTTIKSKNQRSFTAMCKIVKDQYNRNLLTQNEYLAVLLNLHKKYNIKTN